MLAANAITSGDKYQVAGRKAESARRKFGLYAAEHLIISPDLRQITE
jgi:hypothetical protein